MKVSIFPWIAKKLKQCMAITQDGDTADRAIASGKYVCWKSDMYTANQAINSGDTLSAGSGGNLTAVDDGIANDLNSEIDTLNSNLTTIFASETIALTNNTEYLKSGDLKATRIVNNLYVLTGWFTAKGPVSKGNVLFEFPAGYTSVDLNLYCVAVTNKYSKGVVLNVPMSDNIVKVDTTPNNGVVANDTFVVTGVILLNKT